MLEQIISYLTHNGLYNLVCPITLVNSNINEYPLIVWDFQNATTEGDYIRYSFNAYYMEVCEEIETLKPTKEMLTYQRNSPESIQSRGISVFNSILKYRDINDKYAALNISELTFEPFIQRFSDVCSGVMCNFDIIVPIWYTDCLQPI